jgi:hypothetical protein
VRRARGGGGGDRRAPDLGGHRGGGGGGVGVEAWLQIFLLRLRFPEHSSQSL